MIAPKVADRTVRRRLCLLIDLRIDARAGWYFRKFASLFAVFFAILLLGMCKRGRCGALHCQRDEQQAVAQRLQPRRVSGRGLVTFCCGVSVIEPSTLIAYSLIVVMVLAAIYLIARFRRERARRRDVIRGKYRGL